VDAATDELTRPLGADRPEPDSKPRSNRGFRVAAAGLGLAALAFVGISLWFGDPHGGVPQVRVDIGKRPATASAPPPAEHDSHPAEQAAAAAPNRQSAQEVETASGVSVVRPAGSTAPSSVIVTVPDEGAGAARGGPDPRLAEKSRFGMLPKIGADGARPADVYARPAGTLPGGAKPAGRVAVLVGGLGISASATADAIGKLPPSVSLAFAPYGGNLVNEGWQARQAGHEIMLQVPMEPFDYPDSDPGPHTLLAASRPAENIDHLRWALGRMSGYVGLVNYMGAKLTAEADALTPVLKEATSRGLVVLDDGSSSRSRIVAVAGEQNGARADRVIDAVPRAADIDKALQDLEATARSRGFAIGTASALPLSIERLRAWASALESRGILLVPISAAFRADARQPKPERIVQ
jgi:polysaccharide deacetylase 2 family uncharacterized protein YibQ